MRKICDYTDRSSQPREASSESESESWPSFVCVFLPARAETCFMSSS